MKAYLFSICLLFAVICLHAQDDLKKQELLPESRLNDPNLIVNAMVMDEDTWCRVDWSGSYNYQEISFDDGEAEEYILYALPGEISVNKFAPNWYPAEVTGGRIYTGDGEYPGPFLGSQFRVIVFDDDGAGGMPGTALDSMDVMVNNYYWVEFTGMSAVINSGSFYLGMRQMAAAPDAAPVGVDMDNPTYNISYVNLNGNTWMLSPLQDFMIRAWISIDNTGGNVDYYQVDRFSNFDPNGPPEQGIATTLDSVINPCYNDYDWGGLQMGWYAYGIKEHFLNGQWSDYHVSNIVGHLTAFTIPVYVTLCDTTRWEYTVITANGEEIPAELSTTGATAIVEFNEPNPSLDLHVYSPGNEPYIINNLIVTPDMVINIPLQCCKFPVSGLAVDPVSLIASWNAPDIVVQEENFENSQFPPAGWQAQSLGIGWFRTTDGSGGGWTIPGWSDYYAAVNDLAAGENDGSADYFTGPMMNLDYRTVYELKFDSYFDGYNDQEARLEYSYDCEDWYVLFNINPSTSWEEIVINLSPFSGPGAYPLWITFHANDNGGNSSGWAIDNVHVYSPGPPYTFEGYWIYLDDSLLAVTDTNSIDLAPLPYGEEHSLTVQAHYSDGLSIPQSVSFTSYYLIPPSCFYRNDDLEWIQLVICPPYDSNETVPGNFSGYNLYRDGDFMEFIPYQPGSPIIYTDEAIPPGIYQYGATALYDLTSLGYPGETGESMVLSLECTVDYGHSLPFLETWDSGSFETNLWITDSENWSVADQEGKPSPCARFSGEPGLENYLVALESYPFVADTITVGQFYIDFDLKLDDDTQSGTEELSIQVWNWESQIWNSVKIYSNVDGPYDWIGEHIDITEYSIASVFKVRFLASGENSVNLNDWLIDNIYIYNTCNPPTNLQIQIDAVNEGLLLQWDRPEGPLESGWIEWDDGVFSGITIGTNSAVEFDCAQRWEPEQLAEYGAALIKEIAFVPAEAASEYNVRVWIGAGAANLVADQEVEGPVIGQWNYVTLAAPVPVDITQELYIGYHVNTTTGYPAGVDNGPAIDGYGNMMNFGGWQTLLQINPDLDYNWNISAMVGWSPDYSINYAIYRSDDNAPFSWINTTTEEEYLDDSAICITGESIVMEYKVKAIYSYENDSCISDFSNTNMYVCYPYIAEQWGSEFSIYPNPASDVFFIESGEKVERVEMFSSRGDKVVGWYGDKGDKEMGGQGEGEVMRVSVAGLPPGLYLVRVETAGGVSAGKVVVK